MSRVDSCGDYQGLQRRPRIRLKLLQVHGGQGLCYSTPKWWPTCFKLEAVRPLFLPHDVSEPFFIFL